MIERLADNVAELLPFALLANAALLLAYALERLFRAFPKFESAVDQWLFGVEVRD